MLKEPVDTSWLTPEVYKELLEDLSHTEDFARWSKAHDRVMELPEDYHVNFMYPHTIRPFKP